MVDTMTTMAVYSPQKTEIMTHGMETALSVKVELGGTLTADIPI